MRPTLTTRVALSPQMTARSVPRTHLATTRSGGTGTCKKNTATATFCSICGRAQVKWCHCSLIWTIGWAHVHSASGSAVEEGGKDKVPRHWSNIRVGGPKGFTVTGTNIHVGDLIGATGYAECLTFSILGRNQDCQPTTPTLSVSA